MGETTVSGNGIDEPSEPTEPATNQEEPSEPVTAEPEKPSESVVYNYTCQTDNSAVEELLRELIAETAKSNETLDRLADSLDTVSENLAAEQEGEEETVSGEGTQEELVEPESETEAEQKTLLETVEGIKETLAGMQETGTGIYDTVSGNTLYLEGLSSTAQAFTETYAETSEKQEYKSTYGLALGISILFAACCIAGLHIAKLVWGKMK